MNILIISSMYPPINKTNQYVGNMSLHYMARQWVRLGHNVTAFPLLFHKQPMPQEIKERFSIKIFNTKADNVNLYIKEFKLSSGNTKIGFSARRGAFKQYASVMKSVPKPDVVIVHSIANTFGIVDKLIDKLKIHCPKIAVLDFSDVHAIKHGDMSFQKIQSGYDAIGFSLKSVENKIRENNEITKPTFVSTSGFPNFVVPDKFNEREFHSGHLNLLFVGELTPDKNLESLIDALACAKSRANLHLSIIGLGPMEPALRRIIINHHLEDTVTFMGALPRFEIFNSMRHCDCLIMTSSPKAYGLVYLEAMSQGCIPVSAYNEQFDGIIENGENGFVFEENNKNSLADVLDSLSEFDNEKLQSLSLSAVQTADNLSEDKIAKRDIEEIQKILDGKAQHQKKTEVKEVKKEEPPKKPQNEASANKPKEAPSENPSEKETSANQTKEAPSEKPSEKEEKKGSKPSAESKKNNNKNKNKNKSKKGK